MKYWSDPWLLLILRFINCVGYEMKQNIILFDYETFEQVDIKNVINVMYTNTC